MLRAAPSKGAVRGLSYPSTPDFSGCQLRQVSPCSPRTLPCAQKPSSAARVALFRYAPRVGLSSDFRWITGHRGIASPAPFPRRPTCCGWIGSKDGVAPSSARRSAASPIRGTALQRLLATGLACPVASGIGDSGVPFGVWFAGGGLPARVRLRATRTRQGRPPGVRAPALSRRPCPPARSFLFPV
jgi:hypothetical protein